MHQLLKRQADGGFKTENAEGRAIELDIFQGRFVRGVIGGDGVDGAVGEALNEGFAVFARGQRWIHLEARIVGDILVDQREVVRRDFAGDMQAIVLGEAHLVERAFGGKDARCAGARR